MLGAQGEQSDMVTDLGDLQLVSTWTLYKTLEQRLCACEDGAMPRAVGTRSHRGVPGAPGGYRVMLRWDRGRVWRAEGTACAKGWTGCEKTQDPLSCLALSTQSSRWEVGRRTQGLLWG